MKSEREKRVKDFERRASYAPDTVYRHATRGWRYIPVHDFADETARPVQGVDCWCLLGTDAALLECTTREQSSRQSGLYLRIDPGKPCWPKLQAVIPKPLTRMVVEGVMERFVALGFPDGPKFQANRGELECLEASEGDSQI